MWRRWKIHVEELPLATVSVIVKDATRPMYKLFDIKGVLTKRTMSEYLAVALTHPLETLIIGVYNMKIQSLKSWEIKEFIHKGEPAYVRVGDVGDMYVNVFYDLLGKKLLSCIRAVMSSVERHVKKHRKLVARSLAALLDDDGKESLYVVWNVKLFGKGESVVNMTYGEFVKSTESWDFIIEDLLPRGLLNCIKEMLMEHNIKHTEEYFKVILQALLMSISKSLEKMYPELHLSKDVKELTRILHILL